MIRRKIVPALLFSFAVSPLSAEPLFYSSVNSNDIDYIRVGDPTALDCITLQMRDRREMPGKNNDVLFADNVFVFEAQFTDGRRLEFWAHPDFRSEQRALDTVFEVAKSVGRLPTSMRQRLDHVVINTGDFTANAEDRGRFFMVYEENVTKRLATHDLDETVFHESVHATLDIPHSESEAWRSAQRRDGAFITGYGAKNPEREDMAETALIAYTMFKYPGRLHSDIERRVKATIPVRLEILRKIVPLETAPAGPAARYCS